ncbi:MAG: Fe-S cluster assembly sulfur transfer protein SufU [Dehalococcoidia bacterium]
MNRQEPELDDLYKQIILDHYRHPRNREEVAGADVSAEGLNPLCGDEIRVQVAFRDDAIDRIGFWGKGCSISQSSASLMTEAVRAHTLGDAVRMKSEFEKMLTEGAEPAEELGDIEALQGVAQFPVRIKCALLPWKVLGEALAERNGKSPEAVSTE